METINDHRAVQHMRAAFELYPETGRMVNDFMIGRGNDLPDWPKWCFLPMAAWYAIVCDGNGVRGLSLDLVPDVAQLAAIGAWRYSQGIYRVDNDLMEAVTNSTVSGALPSEILYRLPEWCIYVETPCHTWIGRNMYGFWAHMEHDVNTQRAELRLLLDCDDNLIPLPVHLGHWTITEAMDRAFKEAEKQARAISVDFDPGMDVIAKVAESINPLISILLYLCSDEPEIDDSREPGISPSRATPQKTKQGWRFFPAAKARVWNVGTEIGRQLREANVSTTDETGRTVTPHMRRGHWHGYWLGPRTGDRKFSYRWISPLIVRGKGVSNDG